MQVDLLTFTGEKFSGKAKEVQIRTTSGAMVILPHHEPMTALTVFSPIVIIDDKDEVHTYATFGGLVEIENNHVRLLSDEAEHFEELVESEIAEALALAEKLKSNAKDNHELNHAQSLIDRNRVRLEVSKVRRRKRSH